MQIQNYSEERNIRLLHILKMSASALQYFGVFIIDEN